MVERARELDLLMALLSSLACSGLSCTAAASGGTASSASGGSAAAHLGGGSPTSTTESGAGAGGASGAGAGGTSAASGGSPTSAAGASPTSAAGGTSTSGTGGALGLGGGATNLPAKFVGNITTSGQVRADFASYWNQITPENEGKWGNVERTRNQMDWSKLDAIHDYAHAHQLTFKQHNFVWGQDQPEWIAALSQDEQRAEVEEWIRSFCERYPDVALIDVVNEPNHPSTPAYADALGGSGSTGSDWVIQPFLWARKYCPKAILILNDWGNLEDGGYASSFVELVKALLARGAPIDAIGAQAHDIYRLSPTDISSAIDTLAHAGLPIYVTEYDIDQGDPDQANTLMAQFPVLWQDSRVKGITFWGYVYGHTWRENTGLLIDGTGPRPGLTWLMSYLGR